MTTPSWRLGGFLLTLPFQSAFADLDPFQRGHYLVLVVLAAVTTTALVAPIAIHRRVFRWRRKGRLLAAGHVIARVVLALVSLLVAGIATFVFDVVVGRSGALAVAGDDPARPRLARALPRVIGGRPPASEK